MKRTASDPLMRTLSFTEREKRRIDRAAKACGWPRGESAVCARQALLNWADAVLHVGPPSKALRA
jgi:hypothetical protein